MMVCEGKPSPSLKLWPYITLDLICKLNIPFCWMLSRYYFYGMGRLVHYWNLTSHWTGTGLPKRYYFLYFCVFGLYRPKPESVYTVIAASDSTELLSRKISPAVHWLFVAQVHENTVVFLRKRLVEHMGANFYIAGFKTTCQESHWLGWDGWVCLSTICEAIILLLALRQPGGVPYLNDSDSY